MQFVFFQFGRYFAFVALDDGIGNGKTEPVALLSGVCRLPGAIESVKQTWDIRIIKIGCGIAYSKHNAL